MKRLLILMMAFSLKVLADNSDPVIAFRQMTHFPPGTIIYRWDADVNGDGGRQIFLDPKNDYDEQSKHGNPKLVAGWYVYLKYKDKSGYLFSRGVSDSQSGAGIEPTAPEIDPEIMYIGPISQLGKRGIVTVQTDYAEHLPAVSYIRAYTVEGDHLGCFLLGQYDPTKGKNPVYEQYLSPSKRTSVQLKEITIPK